MPALTRPVRGAQLLALIGLVSCGDGAPDRVPIELPPAGTGMPRIERRPLAIAPPDLPDERYFMFAVGERGDVVYSRSLEEYPKLVVLDSTGHREAAFGRSGEGPGEFGLPAGLELLRDTIRLVATDRSARISYTIDGTLLEERRIYIGDIPLAWHADSMDHWLPPLGSARPGVRGEVIRSAFGERTGRVLVNDDDSVFAAAIATHAGNPPLSFPFAATEDRFWIADPWDYVIRVFNADGAPLATFSPDLPPNTRGPRALALLRDQLARRPKLTRGPDGQAIPLPDESARLDTLERERTRFFGRNPLHLDAHGRLWVVGYHQDSTSVDVFRDSTRLGRAVLPCFPARNGTVVAFNPAGWLLLECEVDTGDWPTELQLYRIVER